MKQTILVFDDDEDILEICKHILESKGFNVFTNNRCDYVIEEIEKHSPNVIIMDNWIPEIGGVAATQLVKNHPEHHIVPVILFTASKDIEKLAADAQADAYLEKPFSLKEIQDKVASVLTTA